MATKKDKRIATEKAALKQRLNDIALGAYGDCNKPDFNDQDGGGMPFRMGLDAFGRFLGGVKNALLNEEQGKVFLRPVYFEHWDAPLDEVADWLYKIGIRA